MSDETILLPCPFCGGEAHVIVSSDGYGVECWGELCTKNQLEEIPTEAEAIAAWNTRAPVEYEGWFYLPKPKNSLVHYGTPQIEKMENGYKAKQPVEIIESAISAWGDELGEYIMKRICEVWNTRTHGTLTAEQVMSIAGKHQPDYCSDTHACFDWQAIADELNALGSGTCELEKLEAIYVTLNMLNETSWGVCSECGTASPMDATYCCECGRKVKR